MQDIVQITVTLYSKQLQYANAILSVKIQPFNPPILKHIRLKF